MLGSKIVYENAPFYVVRLSDDKWEIRKNTATHSVVMGIAPSLALATRFVDRACQHPERF
jgi:hypothetical protein